MLLNVKVQPNSGRQEIKEVTKHEYRVFLKSLPKDNKANLELIKILKKKFKKDIKIVSGLNSRKKVVEIKLE